MNSEVLPLTIVEDAYNILEDEDLEVLSRMLSELLDNTTSIQATAKKLTDWIALEAKTRSEELDKSGSGREDSDNLIHGPNPLGLVEGILVGIVSAASSFPPQHQAQTKVLDLLQCMKGADPTPVPQSIPQEDEGGKSNIIQLWRGDVWNGIEGWIWDWFCSYGKGKHNPLSALPPSPESPQRWVNLQSFLARASATNTSLNCSACSSLFDLFRTPLATYGPDKPAQAQIDKSTLAKSGKTSIIAAAQWLATEANADWILRKCRQRQHLNEDEIHNWWERRTWCLDYWGKWRGFFADLATAGRLESNEDKEIVKWAKLVEEAMKIVDTA